MKKILTLVLCLIAVSFACQSGGLVQAQIEDTHDVVLDYSNVKSTRFAASKSAAVENALYSQGIGETVDDIDTVEMNTVCSELEVDENNFDLSEEIKEEQKVTEESGNEGTMSENQILQSLAAIQEELGLKGTDVITELEEQIAYYQAMLESGEYVERTEQINNLITTTQELINEYQSYTNSAKTRGSFHLIYTPAVAMVIAYFNSNSYNLAAELLTHARDNNDLDSIYVPINSNDVLSSSIFTNIRNSSVFEGSSSFPNSGSTNDQDLYYALHAFNYSKSASGRVVVIQDRYDYAPNNDYGSIGGMAVDLMYSAQEAGVLVPYYSVITHNFNGVSTNPSETINIASNKRYYEDKVTLGKGEYKDYYITFGASGTKVIQTFGEKDSYLYLYDANDKLLASNDDGGYKTNSLIRYYCSANSQYKVRVKFYSTSQSGEIKLAITPSYGALKSDASYLDKYENIYNTSSSNFTFNTFSTKGYVRLFTYTPAEKADYTIETEGNIDTYIYLIDPRSTYLLTSAEYNDDAGEGLNASISKELAQNIPYLIVYSRYNLNGDGANFSLRLYKN